MAADDTVWTGVQNSFAGALVVPGSSSVSVYLTGSMAATTYPIWAPPARTASPPTRRRTTGSRSTAAHGPADLVNYVDADAAMSPVTEDADDSATSTSLDDDSGTTLPPGLFHTGGTNLSAGTETVAATKMRCPG